MKLLNSEGPHDEVLQPASAAGNPAACVVIHAVQFARSRRLPLVRKAGPGSAAGATQVPEESRLRPCRCFSTAAAAGLVVLVNAADDALDNMFESPVNATGGSCTTKCFGYGAFLATRYKNYDNILWYIGEDFQTWNSSANDRQVQQQVMAGMISV